jgi:RNA polymerase-binding transcription factor DksA
MLGLSDALTCINAPSGFSCDCGLATLEDAMARLEERRKALNSRLAELDARLHTIEDSLDETPDRDWEELALEREDDEVLETMGLTAQAETRMIKAALARMDDGTFGTCVSCGEAISDARLDVLPYTPFCKTCADPKKR